MGKRVAIVGVGQTVFEAEKKGATFADLVHEATTKALEDAGMTIGQIGNIVTASNDFVDGRTISSMPVGDAAGAAFGDGKNISTVEGDGAFAAIYGLSRVLSGAYDTTLVIAHAKPSEGEYSLISNAYFDPIYERALGMDWITSAALQARLFLEASGKTEEDCARVVARNRQAGVSNPFAQLRQPATMVEILSSEPMAPPIKREEIAPLSDGAAALIFAEESTALKLGKKPIWIEGVGTCADGRMTERDLSRAPALAAAAKTAFAMAGVTRPLKELDSLELHAPFSYQELLWLSELGLQDYPILSINKSGGCLCAYSPVASGLVRMIEAAQQLRRSGWHALAHGQHGPCGQAHAVWILGADRRG